MLSDNCVETEQPILQEATRGDGGTQGLDWHDALLRMDAEGDWKHLQDGDASVAL